MIIIIIIIIFIIVMIKVIIILIIIIIIIIKQQNHSIIKLKIRPVKLIEKSESLEIERCLSTISKSFILIWDDLLISCFNSFFNRILIHNSNKNNSCKF